MAGLLKVALADQRVRFPPFPPPHTHTHTSVALSAIHPLFHNPNAALSHFTVFSNALPQISPPLTLQLQVADAQAIADALATDYKTKLEIPYVSAAIAQLHVHSAANASAAGATPAQLLAAITHDPTDHHSRLALAGLLFAQGEKEAAIDHVLQSVKLDRFAAGCNTRLNCCVVGSNARA